MCCVLAYFSEHDLLDCALTLFSFLLPFSVKFETEKINSSATD